MEFKTFLVDALNASPSGLICIYWPQAVYAVNHMSTHSTIIGGV